MQGWPTLLTLLLAVSAAPCGPGSGSVEPEGEAGEAADAGADGNGNDERVPASACLAGELCTQYGQSCVAGRERCQCTGPCTGVELPPEQMRPRWQCREPDPRCPEGVPEEGARCRPNGLACGYGTCGGASATCEGRRWKVVHYGPPP